MIEVQLSGGLGNQMFQYAFYVYLKQNNSEVALNTYDFKIHKHHYGFELKRIFGIKDEINEQKCSFSVNHNNIIIRIIKKIFNVSITTNFEYIENYEISNIDNHQYIRDIFFTGFWQNIKYVKPIEDILRKIFVFPELDEKNQQFIKNLYGKNTVSVHVRRGDYLKANNLGGICDRQYYETAFGIICKNIENPYFIIFSDDTEWCNNEFIGTNIAIVDWNKGIDSFRDMQLMSLCNHHIIANSTFSWWAAFLNNAENKIIIAPHKWDSLYDSSKIIDEGWIVI